MAPQSVAAEPTSVSSTAGRSNVERLIAFSTSAVAVCCCSASLSSAVRAWTSSNRRTFSMAMTAWSAKVCDELDLACVETARFGRGRARTRRSAPPRAAAGPPRRCDNRRASGQSRASCSPDRARTSSIWTIARSATTPSDRRSASRGRRVCAHVVLEARLGNRAWRRMLESRHPAHEQITPLSASTEPDG